MKYVRYLRLERKGTRSLMTYRLPQLLALPEDDASWPKELDKWVEEILPGWYWLAADEENVYDEAPNEPDVTFPLEDF